MARVSTRGQMEELMTANINLTLKMDLEHTTGQTVANTLGSGSMENSMVKENLLQLLVWSVEAFGRSDNV